MALTAEQLAAISAIANGGGAAQAPPADPVTAQAQVAAAPASSAASTGAGSDMSAVIAAAAQAGAQAAIAALRAHGQAAPAAAPTQRAATYSRPPVSDGGGQAAPGRNLDGVNLFTMSEQDRAHVIRAKGLDWYRRTLQEQARSTVVKLR